MGKPLRIVAIVLAVGLGISWVFRLTTPTLSEQQVRAIALREAEHLGPGSVTTQADLYPADQVRTSTGQLLTNFRSNGCLTWLPLPTFLCPTRSIWVVRTHTPGRGNYDQFFDSNTGRPALP